MGTPLAKFAIQRMREQANICMDQVEERIDELYARNTYLEKRERYLSEVMKENATHVCELCVWCFISFRGPECKHPNLLLNSVTKDFFCKYWEGKHD